MNTDPSLAGDEARQLRFEYLGMGGEDLYGLWEAEWTANTLLPHLPPASRRPLARRLLRELLDAGFVELVRHDPRPSWEPSAPPGTPGESVPLDREAAVRALDDPDEWLPGGKENPVYVGFWCTAAGVEEFGREARRGLRMRGE